MVLRLLAAGCCFGCGAQWIPTLWPIGDFMDSWFLGLSNVDLVRHVGASVVPSSNLARVQLMTMKLVKVAL